MRNGHTKKYCILNRRDKTQEDYGEYVNKVLESQQSDAQDDEVQGYKTLEPVNELETNIVKNINKTVKYCLRDMNL